MRWIPDGLAAARGGIAGSITRSLRRNSASAAYMWANKCIYQGWKGSLRNDVDDCTCKTTFALSIPLCESGPACKSRPMMAKGPEAVRYFSAVGVASAEIRIKMTLSNYAKGSEAWQRKPAGPMVWARIQMMRGLQRQSGATGGNACSLSLSCEIGCGLDARPNYRADRLRATIVSSLSSPAYGNDAGRKPWGSSQISGCATQLHRCVDNMRTHRWCWVCRHGP